MVPPVRRKQEKRFFEYVEKELLMLKNKNDAFQ